MPNGPKWYLVLDTGHVEAVTRYQVNAFNKA